MFAGDTRGQGDFVINPVEPVLDSTISGFIVPSLKLRLRQEVVLHLEDLVGLLDDCPIPSRKRKRLHHHTGTNHKNMLEPGKSLASARAELLTT